jgi:hypothetical protein
MSATVTAEVRQLSADELARLYCAGDLDLPGLLSIDRADQRAARQHARADAERSAWYDAAHAQYLAADAACNGYLLSDLGKREGIGQEMALWTGGDAWAERRASEELREWWYLNGGRLSLANYRRQQAIAARAYRDERDLERMPAPSARPATVRAPRPVMRPVTAPRPAGSIARYIGALRAARTETDLFAARIDALAARLAARPVTCGGGR